MAYKNKEDQAKSAKKHYEQNKELIVERSKKFKIQAIRRNAKHVLDFLKLNPCVDCGELDPVVLTFDHVDTDRKSATISDMIRNARSIQKINEEIVKCQVRCANCHAKKTAIQQNWFRLLNNLG